MMAVPVIQLLLIGISAFGFYALWIFSTVNGLMPLADKIQASGKLPDGHPWPFEITTNPILEQLRYLSNIFWPLVDGSNPDGSLNAFYFAGQVIPFLPVLWLESRRRSLPSTSIASFFSVYFTLGQMFGAGLVTGIWLALHLWFSPNVNGNNAGDLIVDPVELSVFPFTITITYIVPLVLQSLPAPTILTYRTKVLWIMAWQVFPITLYITQTLLVRLTKLLQKSPNSAFNLQTASLHGINRLYTYTLTLGMATHWIAVGLITTAYLFPNIYNPRIASAFQFTQVFLPQLPRSNIQIESFAQGTLFFLQWDYFLITTATILWTLYLRHRAMKTQASVWNFAKDFSSSIIASVAVGPMAVPLLVLWERDTFVFGKGETTKQVKKALK